MTDRSGRTATVDPEAAGILDFWFSTHNEAYWFSSTPDFDGACRDLAAPLLESALAGDLDGWANTADGALALVIVLDQMPRNIFRGTERAFAFDEKARTVSRSAIGAGMDRELVAGRRAFLYLPFEHSEDMDDQRRSVELFTALGDATKLEYAVHHFEIVERFGCFPHRNAALGRQSTPEELEYLAAGDAAGFQKSQMPAQDAPGP